MRNRLDYLVQVEALRASPDLRARINALAGTVRPRRRFRPWMGLCACLAVVILGGGALLLSQGGMGGSAGGAGHDGASTFMSYAGPVFPLTLREENDSITAHAEHHPGLFPLEAVWVESEVLEAGGSWRSSDDILVTDSYTPDQLLQGGSDRYPALPLRLRPGPAGKEHANPVCGRHGAGNHPPGRGLPPAGSRGCGTALSAAARRAASTWTMPRAGRTTPGFSPTAAIWQTPWGRAPM